MSRLIPSVVIAAVLVLAPAAAGAQPPPFGQDGKDVEWVPTPDELVDTMLEMAEVIAEDRLVDLGSGDGRTVIAAARLGTAAIGVEYEENLVGYARRRAADAGVADRASFVHGDLFEFDLSQATVVTMFLLPDLNRRLRPVLYDLAPGTRIVSNTWDLSGTEDDPDAPGWVPDRTIVLDPCPTWCTAHLWIVPAKVAGRWMVDGGELRLEQDWQMVTGRLRTGSGDVEIRDGRLNGTILTFSANGTNYHAEVRDGRMAGTAGSTAWSATRAP